MPRLWLATLLFGVELLLLLLAGAWVLRVVMPGVHAVNFSTIEPPRLETTPLPSNPTIELKASLQDALNSERQLQAELIALEADLAGKTAACEMAAARKPPPLPADRWNAKDLDLLKGCWLLGREVDGLVRSIDATTGVETDVENCKTRTGRICFDGKGGGQREQTMDCPVRGRIVCRARIDAKFNADGTLGTTQPRVQCDNTSVQWSPYTLRCQRLNDTEASCQSNGFPGLPPRVYEFRRPVD
ncbi:MAG: hypothetical protein JWQ58_3648 [Reyranella sp.]|nr:hypothetical protein [Reyranella sp.]